MVWELNIPKLGIIFDFKYQLAELENHNCLIGNFVIFEIQDLFTSYFFFK